MFLMKDELTRTIVDDYKLGTLACYSKLKSLFKVKVLWSEN